MSGCLQYSAHAARGVVRLLGLVASDDAMKKSKSLYHGHRFPAGVIGCAVRWYWFQLSLLDIEELLFERGFVLSYETVRRWCDKVGRGSRIAPRLCDANRAVPGISTSCS
jgi:hypothetical protein